MDRHDAGFANVRLLKWLGIAAGLVLALPLAGRLARCNGGYPLAMKALNECKQATDFLGAPIEQKAMGLACGSSQESSGGYGNAQWSIGVFGPKGSGTFRYAAESHGGTWRVVTAELELGDATVSVFPCVAVPPEALGPEETLEALTRAYKFEGRVTLTQEYPGLEKDARCELAIIPSPHFREGSRYNCHVEIRCGTQVIYGWEGTGYNRCLIENGQVISAHDPRDTSIEGDPILELDLREKKVVVRDEKPRAFRVVLSIDSPRPL